MIGYNCKEVHRLEERPGGQAPPSLVAKINAFEAELEKLSDDDLRQKTAAWKEDWPRYRIMKGLPSG